MPNETFDISMCSYDPNHPTKKEEEKSSTEQFISELFLSRCYGVDLRVVNKKIG